MRGVIAVEPLKSAYRRLRRVPVIRGILRQMLPRGVCVIDGLSYDFDPRTNETDRKAWLAGTLPEPASRAALFDGLAKSRVLFVDIGANSGTYTAPALRRFGDGSHVIAIEPNPVLVARLRRTLAMNGLEGSVTVIDAALAAQDGVARLHFARGNHGMASIAQSGGGGEGIDVPTRTLADVLTQAPACERIIVKIDVEGAEDMVLCPFFKTTDPALLPERVLVEMSHRDRWSEDLIAMMAGLGYAERFRGEGNALMVRTA